MNTENTNLVKCVNCDFWESEGEYGECLRRAPIPLLEAQIPSSHYDYRQELAIWPLTNKDDSCGEWKARIKVQCQNCKYWDRFGEEKDGACHLRPQMEPVWPITMSDDWCGHWWQKHIPDGDAK